MVFVPGLFLPRWLDTALLIFLPCVALLKYADAVSSYFSSRLIAARGHRIKVWAAPALACIPGGLFRAGVHDVVFSG